MKKLLGVCFLFVLAFAVAPFCADSISVVNANTSTSTDFSGRMSYFKTYDDTSGIFILKESTHEIDSVFHGAIAINQSSGNLYDFTLFKYEAVREVEVNGAMKWEKTNFLTVPDDGKIVYGEYNKTINYWLLKNAPLGKYGVRVTAYIGGTAENEYQDAIVGYSIYSDYDMPVSSVYCIVYGQELEYIYCEDARGWNSPKYKGNSFYNVYESGNGLGKRIGISVMFNPGAVYVEDPQILSGGGGGSAGKADNLSLDNGVCLNSLSMQVENMYGYVLDWSTVSTTSRSASVSDGVINLDLPRSMAAEKFFVRVWHTSNPAISGTFIIDNGDGVNGALGSGEMGMVLLIFGVVMIGFGGVLYIWPKTKLYLQMSAVEREEKWRLRKAGVEIKKIKEKESRTAYQTVQDITKKLEDTQSISKVERDELLKQREEEYSKTKSGGFLQKLHQSRMRREMARDAGVSMEEFKKFEEEKLRIDVAKKQGLSDIRTRLSQEAGDLKIGSIITEEQEAEAIETERKRSLRQSQSESGQPEFELLESIKAGSDPFITELKKEAEKTDIEKMMENIKEAEAAAEKEKGTNLLDRLKKFTGEE